MAEIRSSNTPSSPPTADTTLDEAAVLKEVGCLFAAHRWAEAAVLLDQIGIQTASASSRLQRNLARNLASLQEHRPSVYAAIIAAPQAGRYQPLATKSGGLSLAERGPNGSVVAIGSTDDPAAEAAGVVDQLLIQWPAHLGIVLAGAGDGHLLARLAEHGAVCADGSTRPVVVIEPDLALLVQILLIHDLTADDGPILQERFAWFIGETWCDDFERVHLEDPWRASPNLLVRQGARSEAIATGVKTVQKSLEARDEALSAEILAHYNTLEADSLAALIADDPAERPRPPRVLLPASRFTSVLQYAYRDAAEAFEAMGWEVAMLQEPSRHHRMGLTAIRHHLASFKPDLVLLIDHLRSEYGDTFPANLPIATWTQDHLPNLTSRTAGRTVGLRDYILTTVAPWYASEFEYPARQCLHLPKLTRGSRPRASDRVEGHEVIYVSNASTTEDVLLESTVETIRRFPGISPQTVALAKRCGKVLVDSYAKGETHPYLWHLGLLVDALAADSGHVFANPSERTTLLQALNHPLNNTLYRQQTLRWVASASRDLGLDLALYGTGWAAHPEFAAFDCGPVNYGQDLEALTRVSHINLQIVPSFCLHQRMLDGLAAGGFYLVRPAPADILMPRLAKFLLEQCPDDVVTTADARAALAGDSLSTLERLLRESECLTALTGPVDLVTWVKCCLKAKVLNGSGEALPRFDEITFSNEVDLRERIAQFLPDKNARQEIAAAQWRAVESHLTYEAGLRRIVAEIRALLRDEVSAQS